MTNWQKGDFVEIDGLLAVVVGIAGDPDVPEEHVALWFGNPPGQRVSEGGIGAGQPEVWTVPAELCHSGPEPVYLH